MNQKLCNFAMGLIIGALACAFLGALVGGMLKPELGINAAHVALTFALGGAAIGGFAGAVARCPNQPKQT